MKILLASLLAGCVFFGIARGQETNSPPAPGSPPASNNLFAQLGRGVNLGNFLEAPEEGKWTGRLLQEDDFSTISQAGFTVIRVPIRWSGHVGAAPNYLIDPTFLARVDWVVAQAKKNHLQVILDYHHDGDLMKDPDANAGRFLATWKQIAEHYQNEPPSILFELLNEPEKQMDAPHWNDLLAKTLAVVRATNPHRSIVVGPVRWNSIGSLKDLVLPADDRNLIVTFHFYHPMEFTHQGASWVEGSDAWLGTTWQGTDAEKQVTTDKFDRAADWGIANQRPILLGEFGSYEKGDMDSRVRWTAFVARSAEARGFAWTYWEFCSSFGVYDPQAKQWRQPLFNALLPK